jgi:hypothetical protein
MTTIVDGQGRARDGYSSLPRSRPRCSHGESESADAAVKDKGFVAVRRHGSRSVEIRWRPSAVKPRALQKAIELLSNNDWERFVLTSWTTGWQTSLVGTLPAAIQHLIGLTTAAQSTRERDFRAHRYAPKSIAADAAFARIQDAWRAARGVRTRGLIEAVTEAACGRCLEVVPQDGASRLVLDAVGNGYSLYGRGWRAVAVGGRFEDMPDFEYAQWAAQSYREVFRAGQPIFEEISAAVRLPRSGRFLLTYRRVILPVGGGEHPALLLGATLNQNVMPLALGAGDELGDVLQ